ncbi:MAG: TldD/PmbA family protein [Actinomycetota bacterium]|nr:TldD/PmbA family protein [Actinomycetota bacterium]
MKLEFDTLEKALAFCAANGAGEAEVFLEKELSLEAKVFSGCLEGFSHSESRGIGFRVWLGEKLGRAYSSDISDSSLERTAKSALEVARVSPESRESMLPERKTYPPKATEGLLLGEDLELWSDELENLDPAKKIELAFSLEKLALRYDEKIRGVEASSYEESMNTVMIANTNGFKSAYRSSFCSCYLVAIAGIKGDSQTGFAFDVARTFSALKAQETATQAASKAVSFLGAGQMETGKQLVLFDNISAAHFMGVLAVALNGESVSKSRSFLAGKIERKVASECVSLVDDGIMKGGLGTSPFDDEGVATMRKLLIDGGYLRTFIHNSSTARRLGTITTGNAGRVSYKSRVGVKPTNFFLEPGGATPEELRSEMGKGLEVVEIQGAHVGLNPTTGEISVGVRGYEVEGGRRVKPVREVTIAGNMEDFLKGIVGVGNDLRFVPFVGGVGAPSILVEGLTVSGK